VKRFFALFAVAAAAAAFAVPSGSAVDTQGPACADIVFGDGGYTLLTTPPSLQWRFDLAAPSCASVTYTLYIYDSTGTTLLATQTVSGISDETSLSFNQNFSGANGEPAADPNGVCLVGTTSLGRHVADRAPDTGCLPLAPDSGGGVGFQ
jgi:hypothetical protein